jgi:hypothetical protein
LVGPEADWLEDGGNECEAAGGTEENPAMILIE